MMKHVFLSSVLALLPLTAGASCTDPTLISIAVTPTAATVPVGDGQTFQATGTYSCANGGTLTRDVTVAWSSSNTAVATITPYGINEGWALVSNKAGVGAKTTIRAALDSISTSVVLTAGPAVIVSSKTNPQVAQIVRGKTQQFKVTEYLSNGSTRTLTTGVKWSSSNPSVATINSSGLATGNSGGGATIQAVAGLFTSTASLTVTTVSIGLKSITISPSAVSLAKGQTQQYRALGLYANGTTIDITTMVNWTSSNASAADIGPTGVAAGLAPGDAFIKATAGAITSNSSALTVTGAQLRSITIAPDSLSLPVGGKFPLVATGSYSDGSQHMVTTQAAWSSSASGVATVAASGVTTGVSAGMANLTARIGSISAQAGVQIKLHGFVSTGSLATPRVWHTATLLTNGKVLVAGGDGDQGPITSAELYNPATGVFSATGSLRAARYLHTATRLNNGKVLITGGYAPSGALASAELYDPATGTFHTTGNMITPRVRHTATLLNDGKVLVAGGYDYATNSELESAELYDPVTGKFSLTGSMGEGRDSLTATLLVNGEVLVTGGTSATGVLSSAEIYDPASRSFRATGNMEAQRRGQSGTLLRSGKVLVTGGANASGNLISAELYDPKSGRFSATSNMSAGRYDHTATLLGNGLVLIVGGNNTDTADLYDPATGAFSTAGNPIIDPYGHAAVLLENGKVLLEGGYNGFGNRGSNYRLASLYLP